MLDLSVTNCLCHGNIVLFYNKTKSLLDAIIKSVQNVQGFQSVQIVQCVQSVQCV